MLCGARGRPVHVEACTRGAVQDGDQCDLRGGEQQPCVRGGGSGQEVICTFPQRLRVLQRGVPGLITDGVMCTLSTEEII